MIARSIVLSFAIFMTAEPQQADTAAALRECERQVAAQRKALANDSWASTVTFARYPTRTSLRGKPAPVDIRSNRYAREFRTRLRQEVAEHGVNFAGAYSLVSVRLTGWGDNWYIIDRRTGRVTLFPYFAAFLDFRKDSDLIVMNARERLEQAARKNDDPDCFFLSQQEFSSLRPVFLLWRNGRLAKIGPKNVEPPRNKFWNDYLGR
jgi:hypothetical protein